MEFNPGYSLTGIVQDQVTMLARYSHEVHLFVNEQFHGSFDGPAALRKGIPFAHLIDYTSQRDISDEHIKTAADTAATLTEALQGFDIVFTHDFMLQGWFLPYAVGCVNASKVLPGPPWMHWIHSIPSGGRDWWKINAFGPQHTLIFPNSTDMLMVAEAYSGQLANCRAIHHIKDARSWFEFSEDTCDLIDRMPGLMQADIVQILPASVDRLWAKRVKEVMQMFAHFKKFGKSVALLIANQWATTRTHKENVSEYEKFAESLGLNIGEDVLFSSTVKIEYEIGLSRRMIRELFQLSNLFIFPTDHETFGLVMPEAALSGAFLCINHSLDMTREITGNAAYGADFGSMRRKFRPPDMDKYLEQIALIILGRMKQNESIMTRTYARQHYNWDYLYKNEYAPVMAELIANNSPLKKGDTGDCL